VLQGIGVTDAKRARVGSFFAFWFTAVFNFGVVQTYQVTGHKPPSRPQVTPRNGKARS